MKYMILIEPWAVYVKEKDFFIAQKGDKELWGENWQEVEANSIEEARSMGVALRDGHNQVPTT